MRGEWLQCAATAGDAEPRRNLHKLRQIYASSAVRPLPHVAGARVFRHCKRAVRHDVTTPDVPGIDGTPFSPHRLGNVTFDSAD
jgi:hypothetical protein